MKYKWDPLHGLIDIQYTLEKIKEEGWKGDCDDY